MELGIFATRMHRGKAEEGEEMGRENDTEK